MEQWNSGTLFSAVYKPIGSEMLERPRYRAALFLRSYCGCQESFASIEDARSHNSNRHHSVEVISSLAPATTGGDNTNSIAIRLRMRFLSQKLERTEKCVVSKRHHVSVRGRLEEKEVKASC